MPNQSPDPKPATPVCSKRPFVSTEESLGRVAWGVWVNEPDYAHITQAEMDGFDRTWLDLPIGTRNRFIKIATRVRDTFVATVMA